MDNPWNIPDWRRRADYPDHKTFPLHLWRWEFMRRSELYRNDWREYRKCYQRDEMGRPLEGRVALNYGLFELPDPTCCSSKVPQTIFIETDAFFTETTFEAARSEFAAARSEWLSRYKSKVPCISAGRGRGHHAAQAHSLLSFSTRIKARGRILVSIDPRQPLDPQFTAIKKELGKAPSQNRARLEHYELALRLLDARSGDRQHVASWKEILSVISQEPYRRTITTMQLKRKYRDAVQLQTRFLQPYYQRQSNSPAT